MSESMPERPSPADVLAAAREIADALRARLGVMQDAGQEWLPQPPDPRQVLKARAQAPSLPEERNTSSRQATRSGPRRPAPAAAQGEPAAPSVARAQAHVASAERATGLAVAARTENAGPAEALRVLEQETLGDCTRCKLHRARRQIVFGVGNPAADLVFVGEGPGADEDRLGEPFVGRAGQLLTKMIGAMGLSRDDVYICNVVKCRPPNNRDPQPDEVRACTPFLNAQLGIVKPKVIVTLGRSASQFVLDTGASMGQMRGKWAARDGVRVMPTYHPAYLLRSPAQKKHAWADLQQVMKELGLPGR